MDIVTKEPIIDKAPVVETLATDEEITFTQSLDTILL